VLYRAQKNLLVMHLGWCQGIYLINLRKISIALDIALWIRVPSRSIKTEYMDHWKLVLDGFLALLSFRINTLGLSLKNRSLLMRGRGLNGDISSSNMVLLF
jgi:hypothetical protein